MLSDTNLEFRHKINIAKMRMLKWRSRTTKSEIRDGVSGFFFLALKLELLPWEPLMLQNTIMTSLNNILT